MRRRRIAPPCAILPRFRSRWVFPLFNLEGITVEKCISSNEEIDEEIDEEIIDQRITSITLEYHFKCHDRINPHSFSNKAGS